MLVPLVFLLVALQYIIPVRSDVGDQCPNGASCGYTYSQTSSPTYIGCSYENPRVCGGNGADCARGDACVTGICHRDVGRGQCGPSRWYGRPNGQYCVLGNECDSGYCTPSPGLQCADQPVVVPRQPTLGESCSITYSTITNCVDGLECYQGKCRTPGQPIGRPCLNDATCSIASNGCGLDNVCGGRGAKCFQGSQCQTGTCRNGVCAASGVGPGDRCFTANDCSNGGPCTLDNDRGFLVCSSRLRRGQSCNYNWECLTYGCNNGVCRGGNDGDPCDPNTGSSTGASSQCASNYCAQNACRAGRPLGGSCDKYQDCALVNGLYPDCSSASASEPRTCGGTNAACSTVDGKPGYSAYCSSGYCNVYYCSMLSSPMRKRDEPIQTQAPIMRNVDRIHCAAGETACRKYPTGYQCTNVLNSLEACGNCLDRGGQDCSAILNADAVNCLDGKCVIDACADGFYLSKGNMTCVALP